MGIWGTLEGILGGRPEPLVRPVPGLADRLPADDDPFIAGLDPMDGDVGDLTIGIDYIDASGFASRRTIRCDGAYRGGGMIYIRAWCTARSDWRTFRIDRIRQVYNYRSGARAGDGVGFFSARLGGPEAIDPFYARHATGAFRDGTKVLLFLAMADGELHDREMAVVTDYALSRLASVGFELGKPEKAINEWVANCVPTRRSALAGLRAVLADEHHANELAHRIVDIVVADGNASDDEMAAAWAMVAGMERAEKRG